MKEVVNFLKENSTGYFATVEDGKPKVRPFQFMLEESGKLFFCTSNEKEVYQQLMVNPYFEFSSSSPQFAWLRLSGKARFSNDLRIKEKILEISPLVKSIYKTANNPIFEIFSVEEATAVLEDFSGQPPKIVKF